jgi:hypothetical protein
VVVLVVFPHLVDHHISQKEFLVVQVVVVLTMVEVNPHLVAMETEHHGQEHQEMTPDQDGVVTAVMD